MAEERKEKCCAGSVAWPTVASIALNLFLVGVVVGPVLRGGAVVPSPVDRGRPMPPPAHGAGMPGFMLDRVLRTLPQAEAQKFSSIFEEERKGFQARHEDRVKLMRQIAAILREETPDKQALRKVMDEIQASGQGVHDGISHALERVATEISFEGRKKIADAIEQDRGPVHGPAQNPAGPPPPEE